MTGDTLKGKILFRTKIKSPTRVVVRDSSSKIRVFKVSEVNSFKIQINGQDEYFRSFTAKIDMSERGLNAHDPSSQRYLENQTFFAHLLLGGASSLYVYKDTVLDKKHFLIELPKDTLIELFFKRRYTDNPGIKVHDDDYTSQLRQLFKGCSSIPDKEIQNARFNDECFIRLTNEYNNCQKPNATNNYEYRREKTKTMFGIDAALRRSNITISGLAQALNFKPYNSIDAGVFLNLVGPHSQKRFAVYNELLFSRYDINSDPYYPGSFEVKQTELRASYLKLSNALRYQFPFRFVTPYVQIGLMNGYALAGSANTSVKSTLYHQQPTTTEQLIPFGKYERAIDGGIGVCVGKFEAECRYEIGDGFSTYREVSTTSKAVLFLVKRTIF